MWSILPLRMLLLSLFSYFCIMIPKSGLELTCDRCGHRACCGRYCSVVRGRATIEAAILREWKLVAKVAVQVSGVACVTRIAVRLWLNMESFKIFHGLEWRSPCI